MKTISFETANSYIKVFDAEKDQVLIYPNTVREAPIENFTNPIPTYEVEGVAYQAGIRRGFSTSSSKGPDRYQTHAFYVETMIALAQVVEDGDTIIAATGLPANHYTKTIINDLKKRFETTHYVKIDGKEKFFTIETLDVFLQPLGSFFYSIIGDDGMKRSNYDELMNADVLVIDIGFGSTDLAEISLGQLRDYQETGVAMSDAYRDLFQAIKQRYSGRNIETATIHPLQLEIETREKTSFQYGGESYPIAELRERVFQRTATDIIERVSNEKDFSKYDKAIFTGGGVDALKDHLSNIKAPNALPILNAQEANVRGFSNFSRFMRTAKQSIHQ
ncbi:conserved hypothetical protein [Exiguobacterium sp. 8H]|uniref:ParM/StbA family protein n=1 Tax=unclassified Exiguobacterium TaxID=2644629 RepID=UPI0012F46174|nr:MULTISPECIES: ParM/StbA family protein [unclassified Exiguobacterium]VXB96319.1 conserved hypothetical protein [Exiguobacterium sp. 8A]VXC04269.1 conserved hypothetical protein [Exiguobacterium sp. 8H]